MNIGDKLTCIKTKKFISVDYYIKNKTYIINNIKNEYNTIIYYIVGEIAEFNFVEEYNAENQIELWKNWTLKEYFCTLKQLRKLKLEEIEKSI